MEKIKKDVKKMNTKSCSEIISSEELSKISDMRIYGFEDSMQVARSLMGSINENLLRGDLIFAYRSTQPTNKSSFFQVVVVNDLRYENDGRAYSTSLFSVCIITSGYTAYVPHMPVEYLEEIIHDLEEGKADKRIIENFKSIIENLKTKLKEGK